jgi:hypothetical protein
MAGPSPATNGQGNTDHLNAREHQFSLFSLFFHKFTASTAAFAAEILGFRRSDARKNSETFAVFWLFFAVVLQKMRSPA